MKSPFKSKTLWFNLAAAVTAVFMPETVAVVGDPETQVFLAAFGNALLRFFTNSAISVNG